MITNEEVKLPAAREDGLIMQKVADEVLVYDQQRHKAHCLNQTAALVWRSLDGKSTASQIAARLSQQQGVAVSAAVVQLAVAELGRSGLLRGPVVAEGRSGLSRRELMKRIGVGAAVALPVVVSVVAPRAAQAATCRTSGQPCSTGAQCCSGICNVTTCT
jgi:Coenzyme PQQ synthesis protein D (PqqD)